MARLASKESLERLQKLFDYLGEFGGRIQTNEPDTWWDLYLEVEYIENDNKSITIYMSDLHYTNPFFRVLLTMKGNTIREGRIQEYQSETITGLVTVDGNDVIHGYGKKEKATNGLKELFDGFLTNVVDVGPYIKEPKKIEKYEKTQADD